MKNLKQTTNYIKIFEKNIVNIFCRVFSAVCSIFTSVNLLEIERKTKLCSMYLQVDESQRRALYKLRQTWNVLFTNAALFDLDKSVQQLDPAWPITATTSSSSLPPSSSSSSSTTANSRVQQQVIYYGDYSLRHHLLSSFYSNYYSHSSALFPITT